jgi:hypothetical protein
MQLNDKKNNLPLTQLEAGLFIFNSLLIYLTFCPFRQVFILPFKISLSETDNLYQITRSAIYLLLNYLSFSSKFENAHTSPSKFLFLTVHFQFETFVGSLVIFLATAQIGKHRIYLSS